MADADWKSMQDGCLYAKEFIKQSMFSCGVVSEFD
jgi:hypothetical protein